MLFSNECPVMSGSEGPDLGGRCLPTGAVLMSPTTVAVEVGSCGHEGGVG